MRPAEIAMAMTTPTMVNEETRISPSAKRGRSSLIHVMVSPGLKEGVGTGARVGRGVADAEFGVAVVAVVVVVDDGAGEARGLEEVGLKAAWEITIPS